MARLFEMNSLSASYGGGLVLDSVNFYVQENDFIGVIGPNGGGKTTLLKVILGLLKPVGGSLTFNNDLINSNSARLPPSDLNRRPELPGDSYGYCSFRTDD